MKRCMKLPGNGQLNTVSLTEIRLAFSCCSNLGTAVAYVLQNNISIKDLTCKSPAQDSITTRCGDKSQPCFIRLSLCKSITLRLWPETIHINLGQCIGNKCFFCIYSRVQRLIILPKIRGCIYTIICII